MSLPFLLEIGCEEIPDWMIVPALDNLQDMFQTLLDQQGLGGLVKSVDATPRRLVLRADELKARQADAEEVLLGPPKSAGAGAAAGFAKKMGVAVDALGSQTTAKGEYLSYRKLVQGRETTQVLCEALPGLILKIYFPKTMYWNGKGTERFIRPIRWIVALLGYDVVRLQIGGVSSGDETAGHRLLGKRRVPVTTANFEDELAANGVILRADDRRDRIEAGMAGMRVKRDPALLEKLVYITEYPTPITGSFDDQFLELPREILTTVMRHHQNYFSVEGEDGSLAPQFVAVMNTNADPDGLVRQGNERVLRARFNDARFFWQVDQKRTLEDRIPDLANVTFQAKLGTYLEKTDRITVAQAVLLPATRRAALLCKCDLTTDMVKEFPELQGIIGGLYAKSQGEPEEVWQAIYDHYKPQSMEDDIPGTESGRQLSFADKWDTLTQCFDIGLIPTGSKDPFALRRAAQGVVRIVVEGKLPIPLATDNQQLRDFMRDRVEHYFREARDFAYDEVRACMAAGWTDLIDLESRLEAFRDVRRAENFELLARSFKRINNILKESTDLLPPFHNEWLLESGPEKRLYDATFEVHAKTKDLLNRRDYRQALRAIASLSPLIDEYFSAVRVNVDEANLRKNRLVFLRVFKEDFTTIADFSEIVTDK